ncbi:HisA/HisF-related TIM barrel protein [Vibrio atypicus]|uniref:HisA/HisF-related TIM barrel protein n=1 Tax=Vibrio atypicus TaxID=558271 RepID=UPI0013589508|nr:HisA/HisF-related TIM barrel protein [Vibrio atypicus]
MLRTRVIPALLLDGQGLVKTTKFKSPVYVGDASNSCRIYNQMEVDELVLFDIRASSKALPVQFELIQQIVSECFMPICYGGGVKTLEDFRNLFYLGVEKVSVSSLLFENPQIVKEAIKIYGAQSIIATLDIKRSRFRKVQQVYIYNGKNRVKKSLDEILGLLNYLGVGEVIVNNIDNEGTWEGFDCELIRYFADNTEVPVVALGGAGSKEDIRKVIQHGHASAVALGSMAVFQSKGMGVLIKFPKLRELKELLGKN